MTDLNEIAVFVSVAQLGSFTGAARALSMPVSTVSRRIADLERQLGVTLIQRTTRKLTLTTQGRDYFDECSEPLAHLSDAERVLTSSQRQPEGNLRISVPVILADPVFLGFLSDFLRNYPRIRLELFITNAQLLAQLQRRFEKSNSAHSWSPPRRAPGRRPQPPPPRPPPLA